MPYIPKNDDDDDDDDDDDGDLAKYMAYIISDKNGR